MSDQGYGLINENRVLEELRRRRLPFKHRVQIDYYEVDFVVGDRIAIEVDGYVHLTKDNVIKDIEKDRYLREHGFHVLRIKGIEARNRGVLRDFGRTVQELWEQEKRLKEQVSQDAMTQTIKKEGLEEFKRKLIAKPAKGKPKPKQDSSPKKPQSDRELFLEWLRKEDPSALDKGNSE